MQSYSSPHSKILGSFWTKKGTSRKPFLSPTENTESINDKEWQLVSAVLVRKRYICSRSLYIGAMDELSSSHFAISAYIDFTRTTRQHLSFFLLMPSKRQRVGKMCHITVPTSNACQPGGGSLFGWLQGVDSPRRPLFQREQEDLSLSKWVSEWVRVLIAGAILTWWDEPGEIESYLDN